ncbi:MAG: hypothetical protein ACKOPE_01725 [Novosphingobium sp.]
MRRYPVSLRFFYATAIAFALQLFPVTGVFLMILLAPAWSIFLINAGMIGVGAEAARGTVSRWWLALPAAFYLGYLGFAAADHIVLKRIDAEFDAANAAVSVGFDPARQSLVVEGNDGGLREFAQRYNLPVVYYRPQTKWVKQYGSTKPPVRDPCLAIPGMGPRVCKLQWDEQPPLPAVTVSRHEDRVRLGTLEVQRATTTITIPDGTRHTLTSGGASPLQWFPMPIMGCALNSGNPSWDCFTQFSRQRYVPIGARTKGDTDSFSEIALALQLRPAASVPNSSLR